MFNVRRVTNGYVLEVETSSVDGFEFNSYVFNSLAKLRKAIKEVLDMEKPNKEAE